MKPANILLAMSIDTDQEIALAVQTKPEYVNDVSPTSLECSQVGVHTSEQALLLIGNKASRFAYRLG